jgi:hypothetical protein
LEETLAALDRGEGADLDDIRADLDAIICRWSSDSDPARATLARSTYASV